jgi:hypothetical protein
VHRRLFCGADPGSAINPDKRVSMNYLPLPIIAFFLFTTLLVLFVFTKAVRGSKMAILVSVLWMFVQSGLSLSGFYLVTNTLPPHFFAAVVPPIIIIIATFLTAAGRRFLDKMELEWCILLHSTRVFVELNLYCLFVYKQVPKQMTFEGGNLDILVGITAPLIWWAFRRGKVGRTGLLVWTSLSLLSVLNAFTRAILSAPFRFQRFGFDQPTVAVLHFPFVLLPAFIVPVAILCHLVVFRKLSGPLPGDI